MSGRGRKGEETWKMVRRRARNERVNMRDEKKKMMGRRRTAMDWVLRKREIKT